MTSAAAQVAQALVVGSLSLPPNGTGRMTHTGCSPIRKKATRACLVFSGWSVRILPQNLPCSCHSFFFRPHSLTHTFVAHIKMMSRETLIEFPQQCVTQHPPASLARCPFISLIVGLGEPLLLISGNTSK